MSYALRMALLGLRRNPWLATLIILAVAVGIGSSTTVYTMLRAMSSDPIPWKSSRLFVPQIDSLGPSFRRDDRLPGMLNWPDVRAFKSQGPAVRQAGMFEIAVGITLPGTTSPPLLVPGRATHGDFFALFDVPFLEGRAWSAEEGASNARVAVIAQSVAAELFGRESALGRTIQVEQHDYTVVGVIRPWAPSPRFYDMGGLKGGALAFGNAAKVFVPVETALADPIAQDGALTCTAPLGPSRRLQDSDCLWLQFWVELPDAAAVRAYRDFLQAYSAEQQRTGRYDWGARTALLDVREWLAWNDYVPNELRVATLVSYGFLLVCLVNAVALMLARSARASAELGLRRALGASRRSLFVQGLWESVVIGTIGGAVGIALTLGGLRAMRSLMPEEVAAITEASPVVLLAALIASAVATVVAGAYPAWRASRTSGLALKAT